jgi:hypothetical protein
MIVSVAKRVLLLASLPPTPWHRPIKHEANLRHRSELARHRVNREYALQ